MHEALVTFVRRDSGLGQERPPERVPSVSVLWLGLRRLRLGPWLGSSCWPHGRCCVQLVSPLFRTGQEKRKFSPECQGSVRSGGPPGWPKSLPLTGREPMSQRDDT